MKRLAGYVLAVSASIGLLAVVHRAYAPGSIAERIDTAGRRWGVFTHWVPWRFLLGGLFWTLRLALVSIALSTVIAVVLALARLAPHPRLRAPMPSWAARALRYVVTVVVEAIRSSPLFMLIIYVFIAVPELGLNLSNFWAGVTALTLYTSCVVSEIVRAGILSLDRGQFEAAEALGLRYVRRLRHVVLPQALRRMLPAIVSQLVTLIKDTSLVSFVGVVELAKRGQIIQQGSFNPIETFIVVMSIYFVVNFALSQLAARLEIRPGRVGRAAPPPTIGSEDQVQTLAPK